MGRQWGSSRCATSCAAGQLRGLSALSQQAQPWGEQGRSTPLGTGVRPSIGAARVDWEIPPARARRLTGRYSESVMVVEGKLVDFPTCVPNPGDYAPHRQD